MDRGLYHFFTDKAYLTGIHRINDGPVFEYDGPPHFNETEVFFFLFLFFLGGLRIQSNDGPWGEITRM